jgi:hypothetical protein
LATLDFDFMTSLFARAISLRELDIRVPDFLIA